MAAEFKVILTIDSQGNAKIEEVKRGLDEIGEAGAKSGRKGAAGADEFAGALMRKLGVMALVTAGFWKLEQAAVGAFKAGIQAVDDFKLTTIGVAATLTDLGEKGADAQKDYARNIAYSKDMYSALELEAAKHFASGKDMVQAWNILSQKGVVLRKEEIGDLGIIVDKIKLATAGQVQGIQIGQELRAMLSGQARHTDQMAMILKDRYGAAWENIVKKHREAGDLLPWLASEFKGLVYASQDVEGTLTAQKSTLNTLLSQVGREGLTAAYGDIAGILRDMNEYLRDHREELSHGVAQGWQAVKELVGGVVGFVREIANVANKGIVIPITFSFGGMSEWLAGGKGIQALAEGAYGGVYTDDIKTSKYSTPAQIAALQAKTGGKIFQTPEGPITMYGEESATPAKTRKLAGDTGKGGGSDKGLEAAERSLENFIQRMKSETARASGEGLAGLDAWYAKSSQELDRITGKVGESLEARRVLDDAYNSKRTKIETDFHTLVAKESGNAYAGIEAQATNWLTKYQGITGAEAEFAAIKARKIWELDVKNYTERLGLEKSFYDQAAGLAVDLTAQVGLRREALSREIEIQRYQLAVQLEHLTVAKKITSEERDRYLANQILLAQQKRFNFEMENNKGLSGWAYNRVKSESQKNTWADAMEGLEGFVGDAWTQGVQGALSKTKIDVIELGKTFALSAVLNLGKQGIHKLFTEGAKLILGSFAVGQPGTSPAKPLYVLDVSKRAMGEGGGISGILGGLFGGVGGGEAGGGEANKITGMWNGIINGFDSVFNSGSDKLMNTSTYWEGMFGNSNTNLFANSTNFGGMFTSAVGALESTAGTWGGMFGEAISGLISAVSGGGGGIFGTIGGILGGIADTVIGFFHTGGMVAHEGLLVAHNGLLPDERLVKVQAGEPILRREAMAAYSSRGITFDDLNNARLPVVPLPVHSGGNPRSSAPESFRATVPLTVILKSPEGRELSRHQERHVITLVRKYQAFGELS